MITAIVRFKLPKPVTSQKAAEMYRGSSDKYRGMPGLIRKYYLYDAATSSGGGVYLWESREAAERVYTAEWKAGLAERYGAPPQIQYFESPVIVDNAIPATRDAAE